MNPHEVLGVASSATPAEIKSAYRKKAMRYHPDQNTDEGAMEKFMEIQQAYEMLTKPQPQQQQFDPFAGFDFGGFGHSFRRMNRDYHSVMSLSLEQMYTGCEQTVTVNGQVITISVPVGSRAGMRFKIEGAGENQYSDLPAGDLYLVIEPLPHDVFQYGGEHLQATLQVDVFDLILGGKHRMRTISGEEIDIEVSRGMQINSRLRVRGKGMPIGQTGQFGDLYVVLACSIPELDEEKIEEMKKVLDRP